MKKLTKLFIPLILLLLCFNGLIAQDKHSGAPPQFGFDTHTRTQFWGYSPMFLFNTITEDEPTEIIAFSLPFGFDTRSFSIVASASPSHAGTVSGQGTYVSQQTVSLVAEPHEGYLFVNWTEGGEEVSTDATYNFTAQGNRELVANFVAIPAATYSLTLSVQPENSGTVSGMGNYEAGAQVELSATANEGYQFVEWTDGQEQQISDEALFTYTMPQGDASLTAHFADAVSVAEVNSTHILVFPNPTREYVNVVADVVIQKITITDITGKNVLHNPARQKQTRIATHTLKYGIYLLHIHTEQGVFVRKLQIYR